MFQKGGPFVFRPQSLCLFDSLPLNVGFSVQFVYSLKHKLYTSQRTKYQLHYEQNVGFCVELYSFFVPLLFTYSVELERPFHSCFSTRFDTAPSPPQEPQRKHLPNQVFLIGGLLAILSFSNPQKITCIIFENLFGPYFLPHQSHSYSYAPSSGENLTSKI